MSPPPPRLELGVCLSAFLFTKSIFKLTIEISMHKIILKMEYFINSMIYQMLKFFKKVTSFYPEMIPRSLFCFEDTKNTGLLTFNSK